MGTWVETQSNPESHECSDGDGREEVCSELVVAHGDAPKVFDPAECVLDEMSITVSSLVICDLPLAV